MVNYFHFHANDLQSKFNFIKLDQFNLLHFFAEINHHLLLLLSWKYIHSVMEDYYFAPDLNLFINLGTWKNFKNYHLDDSIIYWKISFLVVVDLPITQDYLIEKQRQLWLIFEQCFVLSVLFLFPLFLFTVFSALQESQCVWVKMEISIVILVEQ